MLLNQEQTESLQPVTRIAQLITASLMMSLIVFGGIVAAMADWTEVKDGFSFLTWIALAVTMGMFVLSFILPTVMNSDIADVQAHQLKNKGAKEVDSSAIEKFAEHFQSSHLIKVACLEGAAFLNLMIFFVDKHWVSLVITGFCLFAIVLNFPFNGRVVSWIENKVRMVDEQLNRSS